mgnify:CR=1 FL=1
MSNKAIFLDRDGTINEDVGDLYTEDRLVFIPGAIEALKMLQKNYLLFIITNQQGIGKGVFSEEKYLCFNEYFITLLDNKGVLIKNVYYCPHTKEENCICRKPSHYFIKKAEMEFNIDLRNSYCVGDHPHDIQMAKEAGTKSIYLLSGHGVRHQEELLTAPEFIANDIYEAAVWIVNRPVHKYLP